MVKDGILILGFIGEVFKKDIVNNGIRIGALFNFYSNL